MMAAVFLLVTIVQTQPVQRPTLEEQVQQAVQLFQSAGLSDPLGGVYRRVTVTVRSSLNDESKQVETGGWVFTGSRPNDAFAVCWDGLTYRVDKLGPLTTPAAEIQRVEGQQEETIVFPSRDDGFTRFDPRTVVGAALLMRAREDPSRLLGDLRNFAGGSPATKIADQLVRSYFFRGVGAFIAGYDGSALRDFSKAIQVRNIAQIYIQGLSENERSNIYDFRPAENLEELREAAQDRISHPDKIVRDWKSVRPEQRLRQLILRLVECSGMVQGFPGAPTKATEVNTDDYLAEHPLPPQDETELARYKHVISTELDRAARKDLAGVAQIARTEKFTSRHLMTWAIVSRGWSNPNRQFMTAKALAESFLNAITVPGFADDLAPEGDKYDRAIAYWTRYEHVAIPERYMAVLADEARPSEAWVEAVSKLCQVSYTERGKPPQLRYAKSLDDATVSRFFDLLERRFDSAGEMLDTDQANAIALAAYCLDPDQSLKYARAAVKSAMARQSNRDLPTYSSHQQFEQQFTIIRMQLGDPVAPHDHIAYVARYMSGSELDVRSKHLPFVLFPEDPTFLAEARKIFAKYMEIVLAAKTYLYGGADEFAPFLAFEEFRPQIAGLLKNDTPFGRVVIEESRLDQQGPDRDGLYPIRVKTYRGKSTSYSGIGMRVPKADLAMIGEERALRLKDFVALSLFRAKLGPEIQLHWPDDRRDAVVAQYVPIALNGGLKRGALEDILSGGVPWWYSRTPVRLR